MTAFFVLSMQEGDWTAGLQTQLLIFHLNEPLIPNASVIGSTATASACVFVSFQSWGRPPSFNTEGWQSFEGIFSDLCPLFKQNEYLSVLIYVSVH